MMRCRDLLATTLTMALIVAGVVTHGAAAQAATRLRAAAASIVAADESVVERASRPAMRTPRQLPDTRKTRTAANGQPDPGLAAQRAAPFGPRLPARCTAAAGCSRAASDGQRHAHRPRDPPTIA